MILFPEFYRRYGPWAIVAGASEGLGQAYAHVLAERGVNLVTLGRRAEPLERDAELLRRRHRVEVRPLAIDLAAPDLAERVAAATAWGSGGSAACPPRGRAAAWRPPRGAAPGPTPRGPAR